MVLEKKYVDILLPWNREIRVIFDAPHAAAPKREFYTGTIVRELSRRIGVGGVVSQVSRLIADLNRGRDFSPRCRLEEEHQRKAVEARIEGIGKILEVLGILGEDGRVVSPVLLISLHGVRDSVGYSAIIGTIHDELCRESIRDWFKENLEKLLKISGVDTDRMPVGLEIPGYSGHPSLRDLRQKFGSKFNIIQLELSRSLRENFLEETITLLSLLALRFGR